MSRSASSTSIAVSFARWRGFRKAWNVQGKVSPVNLSADGAVANWTVETSGPNWRVATDYYYFRWDEFVSADMQESDWWRFPLGIAALAEFILTGTAAKILRRGMAIRRLLYPSAALHARHGVAVDWVDAQHRRTQRLAILLVLGAAARAWRLCRAAADIRTNAVRPFCARRLVFCARFHPSGPA